MKLEGQIEIEQTELAFKVNYINSSHWDEKDVNLKKDDGFYFMPKYVLTFILLH